MSLELAIVSDALTITATIFDHKKGAEEKRVLLVFVSAVGYIGLLDGCSFEMRVSVGNDPIFGLHLLDYLTCH